MSTIRIILIPPDITVEHRRVIGKYIQSVQQLSSAEWVLVIEAFNLLHYATIVRQDNRAYTFTQLYDELVDRHYTTSFIKAVESLSNIEQGSTALWAAGAKKVTEALNDSGLHTPVLFPDSRLFLAYCLYWWQSFCKGYAFELQIFHDLRQTGLKFTPHDLRNPGARRSSYDLLVSDFRGDVKTSTYFLQKASQERVSCNFFITKAWFPSQRTRVLVVFLQNLTWDQIDGETLFTQLTGLEQVLPQPARIAYHGGELVVADYADWKSKMRAYQVHRGE